MQNNNLLKKAMLALLLCVAMPYVNAQVAHIGDILCTTGVYVSPNEYEASGLEAMGVIFYVDATGQHGWAVALEDAGSFGWTTTSNINSPLTEYSTKRAAIYDLDGLFNTQEILDWGNPLGYSHPAFEALDLSNGWYLPAIGQLNYLYGNLVEVNEGLTAAGGTLFIMNSSWKYWSSTENALNAAWYLDNMGRLINQYKGESHLVRGVRNF